MARTFRRKRGSYHTFTWYDTTEEFDHELAFYEEHKHIVPVAPPERPTFTPPTQDDSPEYRTMVIETWQEYYRKRNTPERRIKQRCDTFLLISRGCKTYNDYVRMEASRFKSDHNTYRNAPAWFRRSLNRSFRAKTKHLMNRAASYDEWDGVSFRPFIKDANWNWW